MNRRRPGETDHEYLERIGNPDTVSERLRAIAEATDAWILQRDAGESDDDFALRCLSLGCAANGVRRIKRRFLNGSGEDR